MNFRLTSIIMHMMNVVLRFIFLTVLLEALLSSGWVCYSKEKQCPQFQIPVGQEAFFRAQGITQDNYSIWLKEHSDWRRQNAEELKSYSFIPQDYDPDRR